MIRHRTTRHADGVRRFRLRRFLYRPAVAATSTCEYYWGPDRSGTEQGAGGVEGLLAVSIDGTFYFPLYGDNANIVGYISETGALAAQYVYGPYGTITETYGASPDLFAFGFSTKYHDRELGLIAYQRRVYVPEHGRWLNRDPIEERGGENLYAGCGNAPILYIDVLGESFLDVFNDVVSLIGSGLTFVGSAALLTAGSVTVAGAVVGATGVVIGVDQFLKASYRLGNRLVGADPVKSSFIQWGYRSAIRRYTGQVNSSAEIVVDTAYFVANVGSSCANALVSAKSMKTYKLKTAYDGLTFRLGDGTPFVPVIKNHTIYWQLDAEVEMTIIKSGGKAVSETLEIGMSEYIFLQDLNDYATKLGGG